MKKMKFLLLSSSLLFLFTSVVSANVNEVIDGGSHSILTEFETDVTFNSSGSGYENEQIYVEYNIYDTSNSIKRIEYFDTNQNLWLELNNSNLSGIFGPTAGFPYLPTDTTAKFKYFLSENPGNITGTIDIKLKTDGQTIKTYDFNINVVSPTVMISELKDTYSLGEVIEFSVTTKAMQDFIDKNILVKGSGTLNFTGDQASLEYFDENSQTWKLFEDNAFGPVNGFPFTNATSKFRLTPKEVGTFSGSIDIIDATSSQIYASQTFSFDVKDKVNETITKKSQQSPSTGDSTNMLGFASLLLIAGSVVYYTLKKQ